jgi:hypothetical protein
MKIVYKDIKSDYTIFVPKPSKFKTDKQQEENGLNFSPFEAFTVSDYLNSSNNLDWFAIQLRPIFYKKEWFDLVYSFYEENFDKLEFNYKKDEK